MQENTAKYSKLFGTFAWLTPAKAGRHRNYALLQTSVSLVFAWLQQNNAPDNLTFSNGLVTTENSALHLMTGSAAGKYAFVCLGATIIAAATQEISGYITRAKIRYNLGNNPDLENQYEAFFANKSTEPWPANEDASELEILYRQLALDEHSQQKE
jgi:hypothetical protein